MKLLSLSFGNPRHGWLPVRLEAGSSVVEFRASNVPNDSVQELIGALIVVAQGMEATVWWHLEPDSYYFLFVPTPSGVQLQVLFAPHSRSRQIAQSEVALVNGSREQVLLPIWRALRKFEASGSGIVESHWSPVDFSPLPEIREALRNGG